jgi:hypothetical protein
MENNEDYWLKGHARACAFALSLARAGARACVRDGGRDGGTLIAVRWQVLIEKDWISFGHLFCSRHGQVRLPALANALHSAKESSRCGAAIYLSQEGKHAADKLFPIFWQWLDAVWQVLASMKPPPPPPPSPRSSHPQWPGRPWSPCSLLVGLFRCNSLTAAPRAPLAAHGSIPRRVRVQ